MASGIIAAMGEKTASRAKSCVPQRALNARCRSHAPACDVPGRSGLDRLHSMPRRRTDGAMTLPQGDNAMMGLLHGRLSAAAVLAFAALAATAQPRCQFDTAPGRLPKQVVPSRYAMTLDLGPARAHFPGDETITLRVRQPVEAIELHAHELHATRARLVGAGAPRTLAVTPQPDTQTWRLVPDDGQPVPAGGYPPPPSGRGAGPAHRGRPDRPAARPPPARPPPPT